MTIKINPNDLRDFLLLAKSIQGPKVLLPALTATFCHVSHDSLRLTAYSESTTISRTINVIECDIQDKEEDCFAFATQTMISALSGCNGPVAIDLFEGLISITNGRGKCSFYAAATPANDFTAADMEPKDRQFPADLALVSVPHWDVIRSRYVRGCSIPADKQYFYTCDVVVEIANGTLSLMSTDSRQLYCIWHCDEYTGMKDFTFRLPKSLRQIISKIDGESIEVHFDSEGGKLYLRSANLDLVHQDSSFCHKAINWRSVLCPVEGASYFELDTAACREAVNRIAQFGSCPLGIGCSVKLTITPQELLLSTTDNDKGSNAQQAFGISAHGNDSAVSLWCFDSRLLWLLSMARRNENIYFTGAEKPLFILYEEDGVTEYAMIMPLQGE